MFGNLSWVDYLTLFVGTLLPIAVGLVTTSRVSAGVKATLLLALSAVAGFGSEILQSNDANTSYDFGHGALAALTLFIVGVAVHFGFWKPTGVTEVAQSTFDNPPPPPEPALTNSVRRPGRPRKQV